MLRVDFYLNILGHGRCLGPKRVIYENIVTCFPSQFQGLNQDLNNRNIFVSAGSLSRLEKSTRNLQKSIGFLHGTLLLVGIIIGIFIYSYSCICFSVFLVIILFSRMPDDKIIKHKKGRMGIIENRPFRHLKNSHM